jgi:hypothetical protein
LLGTGLALALLVSGCGAPQIGPDDEAFQTVDALYTAVSLRDPVQTERCAKTLGSLHDAGRLPDDAYRKLSAIIAIADSDRDSWEKARVALRDFIKGQRG